MIITRTPFRISFAGGGSDFPAYYKREPGIVLSAAISKYMYLTVKRSFGGIYRVSYSKTEICNQIEELQHPIVKECLRSLALRTGLEIVSIADLPAQSGMGSSSSFTVGILNALHALQGHFMSQEQLAREACEIEIERLGEPIGKQDQYIAAYGGLQFFRFQPDGQVFADPVICTAETKRELQRRLVLFHIGGTRAARTVLKKQNARTSANMDALRRLCALAGEMRKVLTVGRDLNCFGHLLHEAWQVKKSLTKTISNPQIDEIYKRAMEVGALGGKLLGAGNGGFVVFYCEPHYQDRLRQALFPIEEIPFSFDSQGTKVIYVGEDQWQCDRASFSTVTA
jgi:D-glycero-alpha-D-manno-heptose-7-phosphate kinase